MISEEQSAYLRKEVVVFPLSASRLLTQEVCEILNIPVGKTKVEHFADGEVMIELLEPVRGKDVFFIQSTSKPVNDRIMELLIGIDACKRASSRSINIILPYYGYARQDRKAKPRQPISSKLVAGLLETAGANRVITIDLHARQIQGFFDIPADDLNAGPLIAKYLKENPDLVNEDLIVVSPDHGGTVRARKLADELDCDVAIIDKRRPKNNVALALNVLGDVKDKVCIVVDDMVDTGGTLASGIRMLYSHGAKKVYAACTHGLLNEPADRRIKESGIVEFICTNSIDQEENRKKVPGLTVLSVAPLIAAAISATAFNASLSNTLKEAVEQTPYEELIEPADIKFKEYVNDAS